MITDTHTLTSMARGLKAATAVVWQHRTVWGLKTENLFYMGNYSTFTHVSSLRSSALFFSTEWFKDNRAHSTINMLLWKICFFHWEIINWLKEWRQNDKLKAQRSRSEKLGGQGRRETGVLSPSERWPQALSSSSLSSDLEFIYWPVSEDVSSVSSDASYTPGKSRGRSSARKEPVISVTEWVRECCWCSQIHWIHRRTPLPLCCAFWSNTLSLQTHQKVTSKCIGKDRIFLHLCLLPSCQLYLGKVLLGLLSRMWLFIGTINTYLKTQK